jgi:hypothetical protein
MKRFELVADIKQPMRRHMRCKIPVACIARACEACSSIVGPRLGPIPKARQRATLSRSTITSRGIIPAPSASPAIWPSLNSTTLLRAGVTRPRAHCSFVNLILVPQSRKKFRNDFRPNVSSMHDDWDCEKSESGEGYGDT